MLEAQVHTVPMGSPDDVSAIEELFDLDALASRDARATDMLDSFDFGQDPNPPLVLKPRKCPNH